MFVWIKALLCLCIKNGQTLISNVECLSQHNHRPTHDYRFKKYILLKSVEI